MSTTEQVNSEQTSVSTTEQTEQVVEQTTEQKKNELLEITDMSVFKEAVSNSNLTVIDFHAKWCGPCRKIAPMYKKLCDEFTTVTFCKADVDVVRDVAKEAKITCMPTFILFRDGKEICRMKGANMTGLKKLVMDNK